MTAAIDTIAELGFARASFAQIARRAGLSSTGLISYHFAGKDDLIRQAVTEVYAEMGRFLAQRMEGASSAADALSAYIRANAEFVAAHRSQMKAMLEIFMNGGISYDADTELVALSPVEQILRRGQQAGEFRGFDTRVMAAVIQRAVDGLPFLLQTHPDIDPAAYASEVIALFSLATRSSSQ